MKCQSLFSGKNKKNISKGGLLKFYPACLALKLKDGRFSFRFFEEWKELVLSNKYLIHIRGHVQVFHNNSRKTFSIDKNIC